MTHHSLPVVALHPLADGVVLLIIAAGIAVRLHPATRRWAPRTRHRFPVPSPSRPEAGSYTECDESS
jgi:hypothetical protein